MIKAPFPWFGGKRAVAHEVWRRFGNVKNYVEPFAGSCAVLLARPGGAGHTETVNDFDGLLANFWRAMVMCPDEVVRHADWPVNEVDLHARHLWLLGQRENISGQLMCDPEWCDPRVAGWWLWGACAWIGSGWCSGEGPWVAGDGELVQRDAGRGINRQLPHVGDAGRGISRRIPHLGDAGMGINRQLPRVGNAGMGIVAAHLAPVAERMRRVRVACGDWSRVRGPSVTYRHGLTGVLLDPPYDDGAIDYASGGRGIASDVRAWCVDEGDNPKMRIALCGYEGDHDELEAAGWDVWAWKARGGYGNRGDGEGRKNSARERIWFSPHCLNNPAQSTLF